MARDSGSFNEKDKLPIDVFCSLKDLYPHRAGFLFSFSTATPDSSVCPVRTDLSGNDRSRNERVLVKSPPPLLPPLFVAAIFCSFSRATPLLQRKYPFKRQSVIYVNFSFEGTPSGASFYFYGTVELTRWSLIKVQELIKINVTLVIKFERERLLASFQRIINVVFNYNLLELFAISCNKFISKWSHFAFIFRFAVIRNRVQNI